MSGPFLAPAPLHHARARTATVIPIRSDLSSSTPRSDATPDARNARSTEAQARNWSSAFFDRLSRLERGARNQGWLDASQRGRVAGVGVRAVVGVLDQGRQWASRLFVVQRRRDLDGEYRRSASARQDRANGRVRVGGMSGRGYAMIALLLLLGLREVLLQPSGRILQPKVAGRDPFDVLEELAPDQSHALAGQSKLWFHEMGTTDDQYADERDSGDVTAIVLHWRRTDNVVLVVAGLCRYSFFKNVVVWNNNPDVFLTREHFASARCPESKLRIYNSPSNLLFNARFLACASASTASCYFQDDDWHVTPLRTLYSQYKRDPEGALTVHTGAEGAASYGLEWCFFRNPTLHTCFAWVGTGAFVSRSHVDTFLASISSLDYSSRKLAHADNAFGLFRNVAPYVLSSELVQLPHHFGHSDGGEGLARNKALIRAGLIDFLDIYDIKVPPQFTPFPVHPIRSNTSQYLIPTLASPHPYSHHARAPDASDTYVFLTNVPHLPPPDVVAFSGTQGWTLDTNERYFGKQGVLGEDQKWAERFTYAMAVDNDFTTAWRSQDFVTKGDYIGVGLLQAVDPQWVPEATLVVVLEHSRLITPSLRVQVSSDGYTWLPRNSPPTCTPTPHFSKAPPISFPASYLSSLAALKLRTHELASLSFSSRLWRRKVERSNRLLECRVELKTALHGGRDGWRFVRLVYEGEQVRVGWGVYEMWLM